MKSFITILFIAIALTVIPESVIAQGFVTCEGAGCSACNLVEMGNRIIVWLIGVLFVLFAVLAVIAGFNLVTSGGDVSAKASAKSKFVNAFIGVLLVLAAWILVDTLMRAVLPGNAGVITGYGPWAEVRCGNQGAPSTISGSTPLAETFSNAYTATQLETAGFSVSPCGAVTPGACSVWCNTNFAGSVFRTGSDLNDPRYPGPAYCVRPPAGVAAPAGPAVAPDATADGSFTYDSGISAQIGHASPALASMLSCIASTVPGNVGRVSSISDSNIVSGANTFAGCASGGCNHVAGSKHYGGTGACLGSSYAVDFGDEENNTVICQAAAGCGGYQSCSIHNGNHTHLQLVMPPGC